MKFVKLLMVIVLMSVFSAMKGQVKDVFLDKIDFSDTTLIDSDFLKTAIADYITEAQNADLPPEKKVYHVILAADNVLSRSVASFQMYKFVYQYLIYGFSELGENKIVDYMMRMPYLSYLNATDEQLYEIQEIAEMYSRVKIGMKVADIQSVTLEGKKFRLYDIDMEYTILLFWSYSCPHCRELIAEMADFIDKNKDFAIVTVNVSGSKRQVKRILRKYKLKGYNICDGEGWNSPIVNTFAVDATPSIFLLDRDKKIIAKPFDIEEIINIAD